jgi:hypothetical protein
MRVTTAFNMLLALAGVNMVAVCFEPGQVIVDVRDYAARGWRAPTTAWWSRGWDSPGPSAFAAAGSRTSTTAAACQAATAAWRVRYRAEFVLPTPPLMNRRSEKHA